MVQTIYTINVTQTYFLDMQEQHIQTFATGDYEQAKQAMNAICKKYRDQGYTTDWHTNRDHITHGYDFTESVGLCDKDFDHELHITLDNLCSIQSDWRNDTSTNLLYYTHTECKELTQEEANKIINAKYQAA